MADRLRYINDILLVGTAELGRKPLIRSVDELAIGGTDGGCGERQVEADDLTEGQRKAVNDL